jgi:hypothetical protein
VSGLHISPEMLQELHATYDAHHNAPSSIAARLTRCLGRYFTIDDKHYLPRVQQNPQSFTQIRRTQIRRTHNL